MDKGLDFLKSQVNNAVMLHQSFVDALKSHADEADDPRFRDLCNRYIPIMQEHQVRLEAYQRTLGGDVGLAKKMMGKVAGAARGLADVAREDDFLRLVGDIVMARQAEDTFKTFREAGRALGNTELAEIGSLGERQHDSYAGDANRLVQAMFVEHVRGVERGEQVRAGVEPRPAP